MANKEGNNYVSIDSSTCLSELNDYSDVVTGEEEEEEEEEDVGGKQQKKTSFSWRKLWMYTGPGWLMSIAYIDPGNIESDLQAGAYAGNSLLWVLFWSTVMGLILQLMSARLGVVTGRNLAEVAREQYGRKMALIVWIMVELAIIGSDIQEIIGSAIAIMILSGGRIPIWAGALLTGVDTFSFLALEAWGLRKLEAFFCSLVAVMAFMFGAMYIIASPNQWSVFRGVIEPQLAGGSRAINSAVGVLGSVIMPHNLYLHSALVKSRKVNSSKKSAVEEANFYFSIESTVALLISFIINLFVVSVFAKCFYPLPPDSTIGLMNAGDRLKNFFAKENVQLGDSVLYIWAIGLLAAGQTSTMTGAYAGQFVMQGFLHLHIPKWKRVLFTRSIALVPAVSVAIIARNKLDSLDEMLNIAQSIILPFALLPVLKFTSDDTLMGSFKNGRITRTITWLCAILVLGVNFYLIGQNTSSSLPHTWWIYILLAVVSLIYLLLIVWLALGPKYASKIYAFVANKMRRTSHGERKQLIH